ncbi:hypothetical protein AVEN_52042-1 [Araneus ventricosus]|uniref:Uncharacterized protein n=1 Tax=Araneus ventricosus TaxID=182803 RepID=A0A4Y2CGJ6_ARAVE|nr:hypothetical protein AVEN_52042-1 [Araneus ventricosus]
MPGVIVVFEGEGEFPRSLIEERGRSRTLRSLYLNGLRNQRVNLLVTLTSVFHSLKGYKNHSGRCKRKKTLSQLCNENFSVEKSVSADESTVLKESAFLCER